MVGEFAHILSLLSFNYALPSPTILKLSILVCELMRYADSGIFLRSAAYRLETVRWWGDWSIENRLLYTLEHDFSRSKIDRRSSGERQVHHECSVVCVGKDSNRHCAF